MIARLNKALPVLASAMLGIALLALGWAIDNVWLPVLVGLIVAAVGAAGASTARALLLPQRPRAFVVLIELWMLVPITICAGVTAALLALAIQFDPDANASVDEKKFTAAILAAVGAFAASVALKFLEDDLDTAIGDRVKNAFQAVYDRRPADPAKEKPGVIYFPAQSKAENAVFDLNRGWSRGERSARATTIQEAIDAR